jgi:sucrose-6-phosphate hydrolase SacC (GH32 family)
MENTIDLHMIIDRSSIEIFVNQGDVCFSNQLFLDVSNKNLKISSTDKPLNIDRLEVYQLESIWLKREHELGYFR